MSFYDLPDYIREAKPMTVAELKRKIMHLPNDMPIYIVLDKISGDAWDDDKLQWRYVAPLVYALRERISPDEFDGQGEYNLLLEYENL